MDWLVRFAYFLHTPQADALRPRGYEVRPRLILLNTPLPSSRSNQHVYPICSRAIVEPSYCLCTGKCSVMHAHVAVRHPHARDLLYSTVKN